MDDFGALMLILESVHKSAMILYTIGIL